jgi:type I restriction-modification system DNA methylase subunit
MFVRSVNFIRAHATGNGNGVKGDISIYGQETNYTTWRMAKMDLDIRGIDANILHGDSFHNDRHSGLKVDYILANPPSYAPTGVESGCETTKVESMASRSWGTPTSHGSSTP